MHIVPIIWHLADDLRCDEIVSEFFVCSLFGILAYLFAMQGHVDPPLYCKLKRKVKQTDKAALYPSSIFVLLCLVSCVETPCCAFVIVVNAQIRVERRKRKDFIRVNYLP